jgi:phage tail sheath protein FI
MAKKRRRKRKGTSYLSPGVYIEEVPSALRPIEAVGTSVAAFVGLAPLKPARMAATALLVGLAVWAMRNRGR